MGESSAKSSLRTFPVPLFCGGKVCKCLRVSGAAQIDHPAVEMGVGIIAAREALLGGMQRCIRAIGLLCAR